MTPSRNSVYSCFVSRLVLASLPVQRLWLSQYCDGDIEKKVNFQWSAPRKRQTEKKKKIIIKLSIRLRLGNDEWRQLIVEIKKQQIVNLFPIGMKLLVCSTSECSFGCLTNILMILIDIRKWPCNIFQKKSVSCVRSRWLQNCVLIVKQIGRNW